MYVNKNIKIPSNDEFGKSTRKNCISYFLQVFFFLSVLFFVCVSFVLTYPKKKIVFLQTIMFVCLCNNNNMRQQVQKSIVCKNTKNMQNFLFVLL